jgi:hypothetical protein
MVMVMVMPPRPPLRPPLVPGDRTNLHHSHSVVVKDGGNIFRRELVGCVGDEQTGLSDSTVPHYDTSAVGVSQGEGGSGREREKRT